MKNIRWPSGDRFGKRSLLLVLIVDPRFTGAPQGSSRLARWETQMSPPPNPPGRLEEMYRLSPFREIAGNRSSNAELTSGPRLTGSDHSENLPSAWAVP